MHNFRVKYQINSTDCGPACLCMIAQHYGKKFTLKYFRDKSHITKEGVSLYGLSAAAEDVGLHTLCAKITEPQLSDEMPLPCILHWDDKHYVVCYRIKGSGEKKHYYISDPNIGKTIYSAKELRRHWISGTLYGEDQPKAVCRKPSTWLRHKDWPRRPALEPRTAATDTAGTRHLQETRISLSGRSHQLA